MKFRNYINIFLIITWMIVIFNFSNQTGSSSSGLSSKVVITIAEIINKDLTQSEKDELVEKYGYIVIDLKERTKLSFIISSLICSIYAITDEIHQLFIPGRCGSIMDILIDSSGALTAIIIIYTITPIIKKNKSTN